VESGGQLAAINSWDSAVMSAGFMQWTLKFGELAEWIASAPRAFARHGIELDAKRTYRIGEYRPPAFVGAPHHDDLRSCQWAARFYAASLDPEIVVAQVRHALDKELPRQLARFKAKLAKVSGGWAAIEPHYRASSVVRALLHETYNNRPAYAYLALQKLAPQVSGMSLSTQRFLQLLADAIVAVYRAKKEGAKGQRLTTKILA
jgi:hypothetical protein